MIWDARPEWFNLGLNISIDKDCLTMIKQNNPNEDDCFRKMLLEWLKSVDPEPSWKDLLAALSEPSVGYKQLAEEIEICAVESNDSDDG